MGNLTKKSIWSNLKASRFEARNRKCSGYSKQASNAWYKELVESAKTLGFRRLSTDTGIFIHRAMNDDFVIMVAYVDDVLFIGPNRKLVTAKKEEFKLMWECQDLGEPSSFLQMQIRHQGNIIRLDQTAYLKMVLEHFEMMDCRVADSHG